MYNTSMALGNNRDYKTAGRTAENKLKIHAARMTELVAGGMERSAASKQAFDEMAAKARERTAKAVWNPRGGITQGL